MAADHNSTPHHRWRWFICPHCQEAFRLQRSMVGEEIDCPLCETRVSDLTAAEEPSQTPAATASPPPASPPHSDPGPEPIPQPEPMPEPVPDPVQIPKPKPTPAPKAKTEPPTLPDPEPPTRPQTLAEPDPAALPELEIVSEDEIDVEIEVAESAAIASRTPAHRPARLSGQPTKFEPAPILPRPRLNQTDYHPPAEDHQPPAAVGSKEVSEPPVPANPGRSIERPQGESLRDRKSHIPKLLDPEDVEARRHHPKIDLTPAWESSANGVPETEEADDGYVRVLKDAPAEEGGARWVEVHRDELFGPSRKKVRSTFRNLVLVSLIAFVALSAWRFSLAVISSLRVDAPARPPVIATPQPDAGQQPQNLPEPLSATQLEAAEQQIRAFCAAPIVEARLKHVRLPERVEPLMRDWAKRHGDGPIEIGRRLRQKLLVSGGKEFAVLAFECRQPPYHTFLAAERLPAGGGFLTDWEFSVGYQPQGIADFKTQKPTDPVAFRVKVKASDYYDQHFPQEEYSCYALTYPGRDFSLFGYAKNGSEVALQLQRAVIAAAPSLILGVAFSKESHGDNRVEIREFVHDNWFY